MMPMVEFSSSVSIAEISFRRPGGAPAVPNTKGIGGSAARSDLIRSWILSGRAAGKKMLPKL